MSLKDVAESANILLTVILCGAKMAMLLQVKAFDECSKEGISIMLEEIKKARLLLLYTSNKKALENGLALTVYVAEDADEKIFAPVVQLCREKGVRVCYVDTMAEIGKACNIKSAAVADIESDVLTKKEVFCATLNQLPKQKKVTRKSNSPALEGSRKRGCTEFQPQHPRNLTRFTQNCPCKANQRY